MPERYSNSDIMDKLVSISIHQEAMKVQVGEIKDQVLRTNGRVTKTEEFINAIKAVEQYKKDNPTQNIKANTVNIQRRWFDSKDLVKAAGIIAAAIGAIATFVFAGVQR